MDRSGAARVRFRRVMRVALCCALPVLAGACDALKRDGDAGANDGNAAASEITPDEIADRIDAGFAPIYALIEGVSSETKVPVGLRKEMTDHVEALMAEMRKYPDATRGFRRASYRLEDRLREVRAAQNGDLVLLMADLVKMLNPENKRLESYTKWAFDLKNRPEVKIRGWYQDLAASEETIYAFLDVTLPGENEIHSVRARIGDSFYDLEMIDIVGDRSGILLKYTKTGDMYEVYGRSWEIKQKLLENSLQDAS